MTSVDYEKRIDIERMSRERLDKVKRGLRKYGLGGILALDIANRRYMIGEMASMPGDSGTIVKGDRYVLLPEGAEPILFGGGMKEGLALPKPTHWWLGDRVKAGISSGGFNAPSGEAAKKQLQKFARQIEGELKAHNAVKETLGVIPYHRAMVGALEEVGIRTDVDGAVELMRECREVKTQDEVECLRMACMISESCAAKMKEAIKPGVTERQLAGIVAKAGFELGMESFNYLHVGSGPHTWPNFAGITDRAIRPGDLIYAEIATTYMGYRNCYYTGTFSCGRPTRAQEEAWTKARDWIREWMRVIRPGASSKDIAAKMPSHEEFGYPDEESSAMIQWVHGIGLSTPEWPSIMRIWSLDYPTPIKSGMCLALEAACPTNETSPAYPNGQACRLEDCIHVTDKGVDMLTQWPRDEIMVCEI